MAPHERATSRRKIEHLPAVIIDRIAAGEVIEAPFSVVKELVENGIDAGATKIVIRTDGGGLDKIVVEDDGSGIDYDDLPSALARHATSKIATLEEIEQIHSFGFRGEALASIAAVSYLKLFSMSADSDAGGIIEARGGDIVRTEPAGGVHGTIVEVNSLFYATPARKKFVKSERVENSRIAQTVVKLALSRPDIEFVYVRDGKEHAHYYPTKQAAPRIEQIFGKKVAESLIDIHAAADGLELEGMISSPDCFRSNRDGQFFYVNGRPVELKSLPYLIKKSFGELLLPGANPYCFLFIHSDPARTDVNVHPAKREVRLIDESLLNAIVIRAVTEGLHEYNPTDTLIRRKTASPEKGPLPLDFSNQLLRPRTPFEPPPSLAGMERTEQRTEEPRHSAPLEERHDVESDDSAPFDKEAILNVVPLRHFGVFFGTYIIAEGGDAIYLIDQHTAHERINYEKMKRRLKELTAARQLLLHPVVVHLLPDEVESLTAALPRLEEMGFGIEPFGKNEVLIREVPGFLDEGAEEETLHRAMQLIAEGEPVERVFDEIAAMKACKGSIKRNDVVSDEVIAGILADLNRCEEPYRCPHGRPTVVRLTRSDLDRLFLRTFSG